MSATVTPEPLGTFKDLQLAAPLLDALDRAGYQQPTPIQAALIPHALKGVDVIGQAQTGTGKTAAFLLPIMQRLGANLPSPQAIILGPTRELVVQIAKEAEKLSQGTPIRSVAIYGGQRIRTQLLALKKGPQIIIGTPGRVLDHMSRGTIQLAGVRFAVLDEADRMLDIGFRPDIEKILRHCPKKRQTLLLSATLSPAVQRLAQRYLRTPLLIDVSPKNITVDTIRQSYISVDPDRKFDLLLKVLERERPRQCIIFCQTKRGADRLFNHLRRVHKQAAVIHGDLQQSMRDRIMADFRSGHLVYLVATDVVARGIDVTGISHIINYDLPEDCENYVHRIGRTGRMGKDGVAIAFATPDEGKKLTAIEALMNQLVTEDHIPGFDAVRPKDPPPDAAAAPPPPAYPVFGRKVKRYSRAL